MRWKESLLIFLVSAMGLPPMSCGPSRGKDTGSIVDQDVILDDLAAGADLEGDNRALQSGTHCLPDGLYHNGVLLVSSDPLDSFSPQCVSSWIHYSPGGGYEACCDDYCCDYNYIPDNALPVLSEPCEPSIGCAFGLSCDSITQLCQYQSLGQLCSDSQHCAPELVCDTLGKCIEQITIDGTYCTQGSQECAAGLSCICQGEYGQCACYDGSSGDPCTSESCAIGNYCTPDPNLNSQDRCFPGKKGDPCVADWQCDGSTLCISQNSGKLACTLPLPEGAKCNPEDTLEICGPGLWCDDTLLQPECIPLGHDGDSCTTHKECDEGFWCHKTFLECYDGNEGDPCLFEADCINVYVCQGDMTEEKPGQCFLYLKEDEECEGLISKWVKCVDGLVCNSMVTPNTCTPPGEYGDQCSVNAECQEGLFCQSDAQICLPGQDGEPCTDNSWCDPGWQCHPELLLCFNGDQGDPCLDGACADGFSCVPDTNECHDGSPGSPCSTDTDCIDALCIGLWDGSFCFQLLLVGQDCDSGAETYATCGWGAVCVTPPGKCSLGEEGDPCITDSDCLDKNHCHLELEACYDGSLLDPCYSEFPCAAGLECSDDAGLCVQAVEGEACQDDQECASPMTCVELAGACFTGDNGDPCGGPPDCSDGFDCLMPINQCYNTLTGSPCIDDNWCQQGLSCIDIGDLRCVEYVEPGADCADLAEYVYCPPEETCDEELLLCLPIIEEGGE